MSPQDRPAASSALLYTLANQGHLTEAALKRALELARAYPDAAAWRAFLDRLLLGVGAALLLAGIVFFFAYNWDDLSRLQRLATTQILIVVAALFARRRGFDNSGGKIALSAAVALIGVCLAVFGQEYQTGADAYELFAMWALLSLPWVLAARFAWLWLAWILLVALAIHLRVSLNVFGFSWWRWLDQSDQLRWLPSFAWLSVSLAAWEFGIQRNIVWLRGRAAPRLLALLAVCIASAAMTVWVLDSSYRTNAAISLTTPIAYAALIAAWYLVYRRWQLDLFMLAVGATSLIIVTATALARLLSHYHFDAGALLFIAVVIITLSAATAIWLRRLVKQPSP